MKRSILMSLLVISAASMLVIGGLAFFTGSGSGTGDVTAGDVTVAVTSFDTSGCDTPVMGDGDTCTITANVDWSGSLDADLDISSTMDSETVSGCWEISDLTVDATIEDPGPEGVGVPLTMPTFAVVGGVAETFAVEVDATVSGTGCGGSSATVDIDAATVETP